uniref:Nitrate transport NRT3.1 n=1 Tax=Dianthus spiculifolius TaxID=1268176 RepID=A0A7D5IBV2_9CARY|nr:nitrate transport NRT3.1 [Dianthus spiculifolius]
MAVRGLTLGVALMCALVVICYGEIKLSQLPITLSVDTTPSKVDLLAGVGKITVTWALNKTNADTSKYSKVALKLCYTKASQIDRPWRKTEDELFKDKTCQHEVATKPYAASGNSVDYIVLKDVPTGHYFVRAYVVDATGVKVAYGQTQGVDLFITAITGRHASIDIAAGVFSAFSVVSLAFFFYLEKKKSKLAT